MIIWELTHPLHLQRVLHQSFLLRLICTCSLAGPGVISSQCGAVVRPFPSFVEPFSWCVTIFCHGCDHKHSGCSSSGLARKRLMMKLHLTYTLLTYDFFSFSYEDIRSDTSKLIYMLFGWKAPHSGVPKTKDFYHMMVHVIFIFNLHSRKWTKLMLWEM